LKEVAYEHRVLIFPGGRYFFFARAKAAERILLLWLFVSVGRGR
jgi:hypothetical protein